MGVMHPERRCQWQASGDSKSGDIILGKFIQEDDQELMPRAIAETMVNE